MMRRCKRCLLIILMMLGYGGLAMASLCDEVAKKNKREVWFILQFEPSSVKQLCDVKNGLTAVHISVANSEVLDNDVILAYLLLKGADKEAKDIKGRTPLMRAAWKGEEWAVKMLLIAGANKEAKVEKSGKFKGVKPLHVAAMSNKSKIVDLLILSNVDVNAQDGKGRTALHYAVHKGNQFIVNALLDADANSDIKDANGTTPLALAKKRGNDKITERLMRSRGR